MAYKKRYYKKKKALSKGNIFGKKSAKSQAKQIYALNKKINYIQSKTKPEIKTCDCEFINRVLTTDGVLGSYGSKEWHTMIYLYENRLFNTDYCAYTMIGNMLRPYNIKLYGLFENKNHNAEVGGKVYNIPMTGYLRIIVCRLLGGNQGRYPEQLTRPFKDPSIPDIGLINGPLIDNASAGLKIIKNKVIKVDNYHEAKMFKINIKNPGTYRKGIKFAQQSADPAFKNEYLVYVQYYCPDQFFADGYSGTQPVAPVHRLTSGIKFAFTDE